LNTPTTQQFRQGGCWPTSSQRLLLRASLLRGPGIIQAWQEWRKNDDLDYVDTASFRLLPLLYHNLASFDPTAAELPRLKGIYRYFWAGSQMTLRLNQPVLQALTEAGIPVMLCKGAALNLTAYAGKGVRPMDDMDVTVPFAQATQAQAVVERAGWRSLCRHPGKLAEIAHACHYEGPGRAQLDLHWHVLHGDCHPEADLVFWARTEQRVWEGLPVHILSPADQFFHACEHGARYNGVAPLRWLADTALVLDASGEKMDWEALVNVARIKDLTLPVRDTLVYLREHLDRSVPDHVVQTLSQHTPSLLARVDYAVLQWPIPRSIGFWNRLLISLLGYLRFKRSCGYRRVLKDMGSYLWVMHNLDRPLLSHILIELKRTLAYLLLHFRIQLERKPRLLWLAGMPKNGTTWDLYDAEPFGTRLFCWSKPKALFHLNVAEKTRFLELELAAFPAVWWDLQARGFRAMAGGCPVEVEAQGAGSRRILLKLPREEGMSRTPLLLDLRVDQPLEPEGDARSLGLPLCAIRQLP